MKKRLLAMGLASMLLLSTAALAAEEQIKLKHFYWESGEYAYSDLTIPISGVQSSQLVTYEGSDGLYDAMEISAEAGCTLTMPEAGSIWLTSYAYQKTEIGEKEEKTVRIEPINGTEGENNTADPKKMEINGSAELSKDSDSVLPLKKGDVVRIPQPGQYRVNIGIEQNGDFYDADLFLMVGGQPAEPSKEKKPSNEAGSALNAKANQSPVLVNGVKTPFQAYTIEQNNYFKLRDIASVLSGSEKQFEVSWDAEHSAINILKNQPYTAVGGELAVTDGSGDKTPVVNKAPVYLDGAPMDLAAYTIDGNNYFKLRDLGAALGFDVSWNSESGTIEIDTTKAYTED